MNRLVPFVLSLFTALACDRAKTPEAKAEPAVAASAGAAGQPTSQGVLDGYEAARASLADDRTEGLARIASQLAASAKGAAAKAPPKTRSHLEELSLAASALEKKSKDVEKARVAFGDVSRQFVALLVADPSLQKGLYIYECPMAEGYQKWIQRTARLANPYMGKKMLECGADSEWKI